MNCKAPLILISNKQTNKHHVTPRLLSNSYPCGAHMSYIFEKISIFFHARPFHTLLWPLYTATLLRRPLYCRKGVRVFAKTPRSPRTIGFSPFGRLMFSYRYSFFCTHIHSFFYTSGVGLSLTNRRSHRKKILAPFSPWRRWFFCAPSPYGISKTNIWLGCMMYYGRSGVSVRFVVFIFYVTHIFVVCRVGNRSYMLFFLGRIFFCVATSWTFS